MVVLVAAAVRSSKSDDLSRLVGATADAAKLLEDVVPRYIQLTNETIAVKKDSTLEGKAGEEQAPSTKR